MCLDSVSLQSYARKLLGIFLFLTLLEWSHLFGSSQLSSSDCCTSFAVQKRENPLRRLSGTWRSCARQKQSLTRTHATPTKLHVTRRACACVRACVRVSACARACVCARARMCACAHTPPLEVIQNSPELKSYPSEDIRGQLTNLFGQSWGRWFTVPA
eukprot:6240822-Amphidinium_carterae.1